MNPSDRATEIYIRELAEGEPSQVSLTDRMERVLAGPQTPEEILIAREVMVDDERRMRRKLSGEMTRALVWMGTDDPARVRRMIDKFLPIEEAYMLRRYLLHRDTELAIGADMGGTPQAVGMRLYRAMWRLRQLHDIAWDLSEEVIRAATSEALSAGHVDTIVLLWRHRFSQSRVAEAQRIDQGAVRQRVLDAIEALAGRDATKAAREVRRTLVEVRRRRLWYVADAYRKANCLRMPGAPKPTAPTIRQAVEAALTDPAGVEFGAVLRSVRAQVPDAPRASVMNALVRMRAAGRVAEVEPGARRRRYRRTA